MLLNMVGVAADGVVCVGLIVVVVEGSDEIKIWLEKEKDEHRHGDILL